jgi:hypothetical protein
MPRRRGCGFTFFSHHALSAQLPDGGLMTTLDAPVGAAAAAGPVLLVKWASSPINTCASSYQMHSD